MLLTSRSSGPFSFTNIHHRRFAASIVVAAAIFFISGPLFAEPGRSFDLLAAKEKGATGTLEAKGNVTATYDETLRKDVLDGSYSVPAGAVLQIWAKSFPSDLGEETVNTVKAGVSFFDASEAGQVSVALELKGDTGIQTIPFRLKQGWSQVQETIDWATIGELSGIAFVITPAPEVSLAKGSLLLSLDFSRSASVPQTVAALPVQIREASAVQAPVEDTRKYGTTAIGAARGSVVTTFDEVSEKDVLDFGYTLPQGAAIQLWTKNFPTDLNSFNTNAVKIGIRIPEEGQADSLTIQAELQGGLGKQILQVPVKSGWNSVLGAIDWKTVGTLKQVLFTVAPKGGGEARGTVYIALDFLNLSEIPGTVESLTPFSLMDAGEKGVFNIGNSQGSVTGFFDESAGRDIWKFDYKLPQGSVVGVWSKDYHPDLNGKIADAVKIRVTVEDPSQLKEAALKAEIKGPAGMQTIPLSLKAGQNTWCEPISWNTIGEIGEVVFVVHPMASPEGKTAEGTFYFDLEFGKLTFLQKYGIFIKTGILLFAAALLTFLATILTRFFPPSGKLFVTTGILRDILYGIVTVAIIGTAIAIYAIGAINPLDAGFTFHFVTIGILGVLISGLLKVIHTGKHLTPSEVFQDMTFSGLLAVASSSLGILQAPAGWTQLLMINRFTASVAFMIYHVLNANAMATSKKHLSPAAGGMIAGTPFFFGWLLLLENAVFLRKMTGALTFGILSSWPLAMETLGRLVVVFIFNEIMVNGIGLVTKGRTVNAGKAHLSIFLASLGVVISPLIADLGSMPVLGTWPTVIQAVAATLATMLAFAGLWGEVYLITGILLDAGKRAMPTSETLSSHINLGMKKGFFYSGILMALLYSLSMLLGTSISQAVMSGAPLAVGVVMGALLFPLAKTIIETFDGSLQFFDRLQYSYRNWTLYLRGAVVGFGFAYMITQGMFVKEMSERINFGFMIGLAASAGVSILRDLIYAVRKQGKLQTWRLYLTDGVLGAFVGSMMAFYLDALQVPVVIEKFKLYVSSGFQARDFVTFPLVNKWGRIDLGQYTGGAKLIYCESLAGVINWAVAAWLFAINKAFMQAFFDKDKTPIKHFFSKAGFATLTENMIYVLRWGLWMSPIIATFLRMMPNPTWYNQDGAIRTMFAIYNNFTMSPEAFNAWSLQTFIWVLAFDFFRVLIWMDHMGLRVATLVNLSFLGMDKLDEKIARFIGPAVAQRYIPEGVKRFTTWAPLLIPFYIPRGDQWEYAWNTAEAIQNANKGSGLVPTLQAMPLPQLLLVIVSGVALCTAGSAIARALYRRSQKRQVAGFEIANREYRVTMKENTEVFSEVIGKECDVSRRSYDLVDPCGRILFLVDDSENPGSSERAWPVSGNFPEHYFAPSKAEKVGEKLRITNANRGIRTTIEIALPDQDSTAEIWTVRVENTTDRNRQLKVVPYLEWVLNGWMHDRFHTQYQRLYPEMQYLSASNTMLSWNKSTKSMGFLASDIAPEGFLTGRVDFIGRARSIWSPRVLETLDFLEAKDTPACPTFDPIGSFLIHLPVEAKASRTVRLMIGYAKKKEKALDMVQKHLKPNPAKAQSSFRPRPHALLIGHGEIPQGTPQPYYDFRENGNKLLIKTPFTPRPFDHGMSNPVHSVMVTNRGLHTSCNGNSQQNRLTPDWPDTVTREIPSEAIYLYEPDSGEWYSPTHHPLNDVNAKNECEFGVDGTAIFRMSKGNLSTELTVFVPTGDPMGVYLLTVHNHEDRPRKIRIAPYFQMALAFQPERSGPLVTNYDKTLDALFFENPRNIFRSGPAFVSMSIPADCVETQRGRFFGSGRGPVQPYFVECAESDTKQLTDQAQIASFLGTLELPARGEQTVAIILGQTDQKKEAVRLVQKYKNLETVKKTLEDTREWWLSLMGTAVLQTNQPEFDRYLNWLKYQALAERIWARRGFYQTSGAYGFRDQLQDTVNLTWVDPALARKQIILHASQQFLEGDVFHWFFTLPDGRSAFSCRSHASDNLLWIAWGVGEYIRITGDDTILDEMTSYVSSEFPFSPLPKNKHGWGALYGRSTRADTVYRHCMRSIDTVLNRKMGRNGLPLMGVGDWNDGLDEIGSEGKGESVWLGFFLYYILKEMLPAIERKDGVKRKEYYEVRMKALAGALEKTWRGDRYLRAIHDDGTEIGVKDSGVWEIDALTAAWSIMTGINFDRGVTIFNTALSVLERGSVILLGWPALREDTKPYLGRSSKYPEGVRENGMYCHGVQWLVRAARLIAEEYEKRGDHTKADEYRGTSFRLWSKISPLAHVTPEEIEIYGGQPNKQPADFLTTFEPGRMIWNGYTGAAGWMLRQAFEGVAGAVLVHNELLLPDDLSKPRGPLRVLKIDRDTSKSPFKNNPFLANAQRKVAIFPPETSTA